MNGKCWKTWSVAVVFVLALLCSARAEEEGKEKKVGKVENFKSKTFKLKEKGKDKIVLAFPEDKEFVLTVKSKKESDINLFIYDEDKKEVAKDDSEGPSCEIKFKPKKAGNYTIEIVNKGPGANSSTLKIAAAKTKE